MVSWNIRANLNTVWFSKAGKILRIQFSIVTVPLLKAQSPCAKYRAMFIRQRLRPAELAALLGDSTLAQDWRKQAESLRRQFEQSFWCEELSTYAIALDGQETALPGADVECRPLSFHRDCD